MLQEDNIRVLVEEAKERASKVSLKMNEDEEVGRSSFTTPRLPLPFFNTDDFGLTGRWRRVGGSFVLEPPQGVRSKAIVHFLGGAFVGAAPHLSYKYMLEEMSSKGLVVVTTPFELEFNYVDVCAKLLRRSEEAVEEVRGKFPSLPVHAVGHSCGALLQMILSTMFAEEWKRDSLVLVSWNNKPAKDSIPQLEELVMPFSKMIVDPNPQAEEMRNGFLDLVKQTDDIVKSFASSPLSPLAVEREVLPLIRQGSKIVQQIPDLIERIADGTNEFTPYPPDLNDFLQSSYSIRKTLIVSFSDDTLDESDIVERMLRTNEKRGVCRVRLDGSHITPITQDLFPPTPFDSFDPLLPVRRKTRENLLQQVTVLNKEILKFLSE